MATTGWRFSEITNLTWERSDRKEAIVRLEPGEPKAYDAWLDPGNNENVIIEKLLETACVKELKRYPVSKLVNQVRNNKKECMQSLKEGGE